MRVLLAFPLRRGAPLAGVMAAAVLAGYVGRWNEWVGVWSETEQHIGSGLIVGIPVAAGLGAWAGAVDARAGFDELRRATGRHAMVVALRDATEPAAWVVLGALLGSLPAMTATARSAPGRPSLLPVLAQMACVAAATASGQKVGSRFPWLLSAPACAVATYVGLGFLSFNAESWLIALTPLDDRSATFLHTVWWVLVAQTVWWALVFASVVAHRAGSSRPALFALVGAGIAAAPMLLVTPDTRVVTTGAAVISCSRQAEVTVCFPKAKKSAAPAAARETAKARRVLAGLLPAPVALVDDEAEGVSAAADRSIAGAVARQHADGRYVLRLSAAGGLSAYTRLDPNQFHYYLINDLVPVSVAYLSSSRTLRPKATPTDVIHRWYLMKVGVPIDGSGGPGAPGLTDAFLDYRGHEEDRTAFEALTADDRAEWFRRHASAIATGTLTWSELGAKSSR